MFDPTITAELDDIRSRYPVVKAALVPVLHVVQRERGWCDDEAQAWVAEYLGITAMEVFEVVTFYPMLYHAPRGTHIIHVCRTLSCDACGGKQLWEHLRTKLGVERGGTTDDGRFTLRTAECLASCGTAPVLLFDGERHENLTHDEVDKLLESAS